MHTMYQAQSAAAKDITALFGRLADRLSGIIHRVAGGAEHVSRAQGERIQSEVNKALDNIFVVPGSHKPFGVDGVTALAAYPDILNRYLKASLDAIAAEHQKKMQAGLPPDMVRWLERAKPAPLKGYDPPHSWVSPGGRTLSELIWRNDVATRMKLDQIVTEGIQRGLSAEDLAKKLSGMVRGDRRYITSTVFGMNIPYDALRLARTAIAAANGQAMIAAAHADPFAVGIDWQLNIRHTEPDDCDQKATLDAHGNRRKQPYSVGNVPIFPDHPFCTCGLKTAYVAGDATVAHLKALRAGGAPAPFTPLAQDFSAALFGGTTS